jgi:hypothetical protein
MSIYDLRDNLYKGSPAEKTVGALVTDVVGRKGFRQLLESIDDEILSEMLGGWVEIISAHTLRDIQG